MFSVQRSANEPQFRLLSSPGRREILEKYYPLTKYVLLTSPVDAVERRYYLPPTISQVRNFYMAARLFGSNCKCAVHNRAAYQRNYLVAWRWYYATDSCRWTQDATQHTGCWNDWAIRGI